MFFLLSFHTSLIVLKAWHVSILFSSQCYAQKHHHGIHKLSSNFFFQFVNTIRECAIIGKKTYLSISRRTPE
jgi:hypothetical protein